jgi:hypothetical protein
LTFEIKAFKVRRKEGVMEEERKRKKPKVGIVALRRAVAEMMGKTDEEEESGEDYSALRRDRLVETFGTGRKCKCCECALAESNPDKFCRPCDTVIAEWKNFSWNRAEIEKGMAKHCLDYVRANLARRKTRHGVSREASSGSFMRAVGRREIGGKVKRRKR